MSSSEQQTDYTHAGVPEAILPLATLELGVGGTDDLAVAAAKYSKRITRNGKLPDFGVGGTDDLATEKMY